MLGKFIAGDFIAIAGEMCRFPPSNENTATIKQNMVEVILQILSSLCTIT